MKYLSLLLVFVCAEASIHAQNFQISFAGSGSSITVDNVFIENLTQGTSITLGGTDVLQLTGTTGTDNFSAGSSRQVSIYPNPVNSECNIGFETINSCRVTVGLYDMGGKMIVQSDRQLSAGHHLYRLRGLRRGIYLLKVGSESFVYTSRLIGSSFSAGTAEIRYISSNSMPDMQSKSTEINEGKKSEKGQAEVNFQYNTGDVLKLTATSGNYRSVAVIESPVTGVFTFIFTACVDRDDNRYPVVFLGTQAWMAENLKTTRYNNGDLIGSTTPATLNIAMMTSPKYQWAWGGTESNVAVHGRLYTWFAVTDSRSLCPTGWHVPSDAEWTALTDYLGGLTYSGSKLKENGTTHWSGSNYGANNKSGFTALPAGYRHQDGSFGSLSSSAYFWTSESATATYGWSRYLWEGSQATTRYGIQTKHLGLSVRCVMD